MFNASDKGRPGPRTQSRSHRTNQEDTWFPIGQNQMQARRKGGQSLLNSISGRIQQTLHSWGKSHLVMDIILLHIVIFCLLVLLRIFASRFIGEIGQSFSFLMVFFSGFGIMVILASQKELGNIPFASILQKSL